MATVFATDIPWTKEACDLRPDPGSGAGITRLTGSTFATTNGYFPGACSTDGTRCVGLRFADLLVSPVYALLVIDIPKKITGLLDASLVQPCACGAPFGGVFYYITKQETLCRVSLETLKKEEVVSLREQPRPFDYSLRAASPDHRYVFYEALVPVPGGDSMAVVRVDTQQKAIDVIYESAGLTHIIYLLGRDLLYIGRRTKPDGSIPPTTGAWKDGDFKTSHLLMDLNGKVVREMGAAPGYFDYASRNAPMVYSCGWDAQRMAQLPERPQGNLVVYDTIESTSGRVIDAPNHLFFHVAGSRCGRYVVSEAFRPGTGIFGPVDIVVVNIHTGKHRVLVQDCGSVGGGGGSGHHQPTPYFTSDNKHVIYHADPTGVLHMYSATIPAGFLESLG